MIKREPYFKLKGWMVEHSISQQDIADVLDTTANNVNKKINGTGPDFRLNEARKLVAKFHMPMSLFFDVKVPIKEPRA
mgnify:FL=1